MRATREGKRSTIRYVERARMCAIVLESQVAAIDINRTGVGERDADGGCAGARGAVEDAGVIEGSVTD